MELRDNENIIPENGDGLPVTQRLPQADAPPEPKTAPGLAEPLASAPESGVLWRKAPSLKRLPRRRRLCRKSFRRARP